VKYYVTKFAFTTGVTYEELTPSQSDPTWLYNKGNWRSFKLNKDAFVNEVDAQKEVEIQRKKKVESLKKQITKLESQFVKWL
jgi:hypothetical protein